jgi:hypothetical protein
LVDLNGDGHLDLLSGSWPGELFLFRGGPGHTFAAPEMLRDGTGRLINIGGGVREQPDGSILIAGNAEFERTREGTFVNYQGKRLKSTAAKPIATTGTAAAVHAADWDGDGDFDLLVGNIQGGVYLIPNEGTRTAYRFAGEQRLLAGGRPVHVDSDAGPFAADWDGDGDLDLLVGAGDGSVSLYRNTGTSRAPQLAAAKSLVPKGNFSFGASTPAEPQRGIRSKVCAADWNGDGRLDLLIGDFTMQQPNHRAPTAREKAEQDRIRKQLQPLQVRFGQLISRVHGPSRVKEPAEHEKLQKEMESLAGQMRQLQRKLPQEYENHGWVWLFLRQATAAQVRKR